MKVVQKWIEDMRRPWSASYVKQTEKEYRIHGYIKIKVIITTTLNFSVFGFLTKRLFWFCRFYMGSDIVGESYGGNKFEAYRKANKIFLKNRDIN